MNKDITIQGGKLFFGCRHVHEYSVEKDKPVLTQFAIRVYDKRLNTWVFIMGMDIVGEKIWLSAFRVDRETSMPSAYYDHWEEVEHILIRVAYDTVGREWGIFPDPVEPWGNIWEEYPDDEEYE